MTTLNKPLRERAATIIIKDKKILLMHRIRDGKEYYVVPGGIVEDGETVEETAVREAQEETGLEVVLGAKLFEFENKITNLIEHFFLVDDFSGKVALGGEEAEGNSASNSYELVWLDSDELIQVQFFPEEVEGMILDRLG
ncbi:NUDIX domain-containing protein [Candidatus Kuenenbacteria bacterium]|nr:NUDIX domain-containing protein [Candidatus Kuenenbacteria bacterium]